MIRFVGKTLIAVGAFLAPERLPQTAPVTVRGCPGEDRLGVRREAALSIMDDDVLAFFLVRVVDTEGIGMVQMAGDVPDRWWPYVAHTLREIAREASGAGA